METPFIKQEIEKGLNEKDNVEKIIFGRETLQELVTNPLSNVLDSNVTTTSDPNTGCSMSSEKVTINIQDPTVIADMSSKLSPDEHISYYRSLKQTYQDDTYAKMAKEPYLALMAESTESIIQKLEKRVLELEKFIGFKSDGFAGQTCKCGKIAVRHVLSENECCPPEKIYVCDKYPECEIKPVVVELTKEEVVYDNFKKRVARRAGISIIFFYSREDPVCNELMNESDSAVWTTIKKMHSEHYAILIVEYDDSADNKKIRDVCDVQSYPTLVKFMNGQHKKFTGEMSVHNIEQFISSMKF